MLEENVLHATTDHLRLLLKNTLATHWQHIGNTIYYTLPLTTCVYLLISKYLLSSKLVKKSKIYFLVYIIRCHPGHLRLSIYLLLVISK